MWIAAEEVTGNQQRAEQVALYPLKPLPHIQHHKAAVWIAPLWRIPKAPAPDYITGTPSQKKKLAQVKEQIKTSEIIQLSNEEIANLSDAKFKTLVMRMLSEMVEYGCKIEEDVKAMKSEIKENVQGTNREGKETRTQINGLDQKEEINIQPEQNKEIRIQKYEERFRNLWDNFKCSNI